MNRYHLELEPTATTEVSNLSLVRAGMALNRALVSDDQTPVVTFGPGYLVLDTKLPMTEIRQAVIKVETAHAIRLPMSAADVVPASLSLSASSPHRSGESVSGASAVGPTRRNALATTSSALKTIEL